MNWSGLRDERCGIARFLSVLGDRWALLILRESFRGARRFETFREGLDISPTILTRRLKELCEEGILERVAYQERPTRHEYLLTEKGLDLYTVMMSVVQWGEKHYPDERGFNTRLEHSACNHTFTPVPDIRCSECGESVPPTEVRIHMDAKRPAPRAPGESRT